MNFNKDYADGYLSVVDATLAVNPSINSIQLWIDNAVQQLAKASSERDKFYYIGAMTACRALLTTSSFRIHEA